MDALTSGKTTLRGTGQVRDALIPPFPTDVPHQRKHGARSLAAAARSKDELGFVRLCDAPDELAESVITRLGSRGLEGDD